MHKLKLKFHAFAVLLSIFGLSSIAFGQQDQTFVRTTGNNNNPCSRSQPCKTFAGALAKTNPGGEIIALEAGEYEPIVIDKPVTITAAQGVTATVTATSFVAIQLVNLQSDDAVVLRGLTVTGRGATVGIATLSGVPTLHIENCVVRGFSNRGIMVSGRTLIQDTVVSENGSGNTSDTGAGILVNSGRATISNSQIKHNNDSGVRSFGSATIVTIHDSVVSENVGDGLAVSGGGDMNVERCVVAHNTEDGIVIRGGGSPVGGVMRVSNSTVIGNTQFGFSNNGSSTSSFQSRGNNTVAGNFSANTQGTITVITGR